MLVEEPLESSDDDGGDYDEKALSEKIAIHVGAPISHELNQEPGEKDELLVSGESGAGEYLM